MSTAFDATSHSDIRLLDVERAYDSRLDHRQAEHLRLIYADGDRAAETRASVSWETMAQLRSEMARAGQSVEDAELLELVLVPWAMEQLELTLPSSPPAEEGFTLDFGDAPRPPAVRETLIRYGLLTDD